MSNNLFKPIKVGHSELQNRVVMAPLTRFRSPNHIPNEMNIEYYAQRASTPGTLLISEGTFITAKAGGFEDAPGIYSPEQLAAWKKIFDAVHEKGSKIFVQLWALGRSADKEYIEKTGHDYVAASPLPTFANTVEFVRETAAVMAHNKKNPKNQKKLPVPPKQPAPRELTEAEILQYIQDYAQAAKNAVAAGADGVEIHGANFYLPEQFLSEFSNKRTDKWGGSIENRARFMLAIVDAVIEAVGAERTALRLSPWGWYYKDRGLSPVPQWSYVITELQKRAAMTGKQIAYLHLIEPRGGDGAHPNTKFNPNQNNDIFALMWKGVLVRAGGYTLETAIKDTNEDSRLLVGMGRYFLSTPDIVQRWQEGKELNPYDRSTFYTKGPVGYIDYPFASKL